jgi:hypothetical protein
MSGSMDLELSHQHREEIMQEVAVARLARLARALRSVQAPIPG